MKNCIVIRNVQNVYGVGISINGNPVAASTPISIIRDSVMNDSIYTYKVLSAGIHSSGSVVLINTTSMLINNSDVCISDKGHRILNSNPGSTSEFISLETARYIDLMSQGVSTVDKSIVEKALSVLTNRNIGIYGYPNAKTKEIPVCSYLDWLKRILYKINSSKLVSIDPNNFNIIIDILKNELLLLGYYAISHPDSGHINYNQNSSMNYVNDTRMHQATDDIRTLKNEISLLLSNNLVNVSNLISNINSDTASKLNSMERDLNVLRYNTGSLIKHICNPSYCVESESDEKKPTIVVDKISKSDVDELTLTIDLPDIRDFSICDLKHELTDTGIKLTIKSSVDKVDSNVTASSSNNSDIMSELKEIIENTYGPEKFKGVKNKLIEYTNKSNPMINVDEFLTLYCGVRYTRNRHLLNVDEINDTVSNVLIKLLNYDDYLDKLVNSVSADIISNDIALLRSDVILISVFSSDEILLDYEKYLIPYTIDIMDTIDVKLMLQGMKKTLYHVKSKAAVGEDISDAIFRLISLCNLFGKNKALAISDTINKDGQKLLNPLKMSKTVEKIIMDIVDDLNTIDLRKTKKISESSTHILLKHLNRLMWHNMELITIKNNKISITKPKIAEVVLNQEDIEKIVSLKFSPNIGDVGSKIEEFNSYLKENNYKFPLYGDDSKNISIFRSFMESRTNWNTCDVCGLIEVSTDLVWDCDQGYDEEYQSLRFLKATKVPTTAVCRPCLSLVDDLAILDLETIARRVKENGLFFRVGELVILDNVDWNDKCTPTTHISKISSIDETEKTYTLEDYGDIKFRDKDFYDVLNEAYLLEYGEFISSNYPELSDTVDESTSPNLEGITDIDYAIEKFGYREEFFKYLESKNLIVGGDYNTLLNFKF